MVSECTRNLKVYIYVCRQFIYLYILYKIFPSTPHAPVNAVVQLLVFLTVVQISETVVGSKFIQNAIVDSEGLGSSHGSHTFGEFT